MKTRKVETTEKTVELAVVSKGVYDRFFIKAGYKVIVKCGAKWNVGNTIDEATSKKGTFKTLRDAVEYILDSGKSIEQKDNEHNALMQRLQKDQDEFNARIAKMQAEIKAAKEALTTEETTEETKKLINILPENLTSLEEIKTFSPVEFCRKTGNEKAIKTNHTTRAKNRFLTKAEQVFNTISELGYNVELTPKNNL